MKEGIYEEFKVHTLREFWIRAEILMKRQDELFGPMKEFIKAGEYGDAFNVGFKYVAKQPFNLLHPNALLSMGDAFAQMVKGTVALPVLILTSDTGYASDPDKEVDPTLHSALRGAAVPKADELKSFFGSFAQGIGKSTGMPGSADVTPSIGSVVKQPMPKIDADAEWESQVAGYMERLEVKYGKPLNNAERSVLLASLNWIGEHQQFFRSGDKGVLPTEALKAIGKDYHPSPVWNKDGTFMVDSQAAQRLITAADSHFGLGNPTDPAHVVKILTQELEGIHTTSKESQALDLLIDPMIKMAKDFVLMPEYILRQPGDYVLAIAGPLKAGFKGIRGKTGLIDVPASAPKGWFKIAKHNLLKAAGSRKLDTVLRVAQEHGLVYLNPIHLYKTIGHIIFGEYKGGGHGPLSPLLKTTFAKLISRFFTRGTEWAINLGYKAVLKTQAEAVAVAAQRKGMAMDATGPFFDALRKHYTELHGVDAPPLHKQSVMATVKQLLHSIKQWYKRAGERVDPPLSKPDAFLRLFGEKWFKEYKDSEFGVALDKETVAKLEAQYKMPIDDIFKHEAGKFAVKQGDRILAELSKKLDAEVDAIINSSGEDLVHKLGNHNFINKIAKETLYSRYRKFNKIDKAGFDSLVEGGMANLVNSPTAKKAVIQPLLDVFQAKNVGELKTTLEAASKVELGANLKPNEFLARYTSGELLSLVTSVEKAYAIPATVAVSKLGNMSIMHGVRMSLLKQMERLAKGKGKLDLAKKINALTDDLAAVYDISAPAPHPSLPGKDVMGPMSIPEMVEFYQKNPLDAQKAVVVGDIKTQELLGKGFDALNEIGKLENAQTAAAYLKAKRTKGDPTAAVQAALDNAAIIHKQVVRSTLVTDLLLKKFDQRPEVIALKLNDPNGFPDITERMLLGDYLQEVYYDSGFALHDPVRTYLDSAAANIADTPGTIAIRKSTGKPSLDHPFGEFKVVPKEIKYLQEIGTKIKFNDFEAVAVPLRQMRAWISNIAFKENKLGDVFIEKIGTYMPDLNKSYIDAAESMYRKQGSDVSLPAKGSALKSNKGKTSTTNLVQDMFMEYANGTLEMINDLAKFDIVKVISETFAHELYPSIAEVEVLPIDKAAGRIRGKKRVIATSKTGKELPLTEINATKLATPWENSLHKRGSYMKALDKQEGSVKKWYEDVDGNMYVEVPDTVITDKMIKGKPGEKVASVVKEYGDLGGKVMRVELFDQLTGNGDPFKGVMHSFWLAKALGMWKKNMVVRNPSAQIRNVMTNVAMAGFAGYLKDIPSLANMISSTKAGKVRDVDGKLTGYGWTVESAEAGSTFMHAETNILRKGSIKQDPIINRYGDMMKNPWMKALDIALKKSGLDAMSTIYNMSEMVGKGWHMKHIASRLDAAIDMHTKSGSKVPLRTWMKGKVIDGAPNPLWQYFRRAKFDESFDIFIESLYGNSKHTGVPSTNTLAKVFRDHANQLLLDYGDMSPAVNMIRSYPSLLLGNAFISWGAGMFGAMQKWMAHNPYKTAGLLSLARTMDLYQGYSDMVDPMHKALFFQQSGDMFGGRFAPIGKKTVRFGDQLHNAINTIKLGYFDFSGFTSMGLANMVKVNAYLPTSFSVDPMNAPGMKVITKLWASAGDSLTAWDKKKGILRILSETAFPSWTPYLGYYANELIDKMNGDTNPDRGERSVADVFGAMLFAYKTDPVFVAGTKRKRFSDYEKAMKQVHDAYDLEMKRIIFNKVMTPAQKEKVMKQAELKLLQNIRPIQGTFDFIEWLDDKGQNGKSYLNVVKEINDDPSLKRPFKSLYK